MPGNQEGGRKAADRNRQLYGEDYYRTLGKLGGKAPKSAPVGFAADRERAKRAGRIGGLKSRRSS